MPDTSTHFTLAQLLDGYRRAVADGNANGINELVRLTYHSTVIEGSSLTLAQTRNLIQIGQPILDKPLTDQRRTIDHHQALQQILALASQHEPINLIALREVAATLMAQTGGPIYSLLSFFDTRQGDLRIDSAMVGRRVVVAAHKLPAAIDELLKGINTRIHQLHTLP